MLTVPVIYLPSEGGKRKNYRSGSVKASFH